MTYAPAERPFYDADSHMMELPNFLIDYADPGVRGQMPPVRYSASLVTDEEVDQILANGGRHTREQVEAQIALGDQLFASSKEIHALGAFSTSRTLPDEVRYGATRAHNRAMRDFCAADDRLMGVGENVRSKDMAVLHQGPETLDSMMIMDDVFERVPEMRGACVDLGAGCVPAMLTTLDWVVFESSLGSRADAVRENFYAENFLKIFPGARAHDKVSV